LTGAAVWETLSAIITAIAMWLDRRRMAALNTRFVAGGLHDAYRITLTRNTAQTSWPRRSARRLRVSCSDRDSHYDRGEEPQHPDYLFIGAASGAANPPLEPVLDHKPPGSDQSGENKQGSFARGERFGGSGEQEHLFSLSSPVDLGAGAGDGTATGGEKKDLDTDEEAGVGRLSVDHGLSRDNQASGAGDLSSITCSRRMTVKHRANARIETKLH